MKVPFVDLYAQYLSIKRDIDAAIETTIKQSSYIGGGAVRDFEAAFAGFLGIDHVIACGNGTDSIEILLKTYGVKEGDEVIVPAISWISTSEAVSSVGATPVFVDIDENYFTIDPVLLEKAITPRTRAIIPVHLYGQPADMPAIMKIAAAHDLIVIEDCAQAHGAKIAGKTVGTWGHASSFSFYPGKNLGAYGDAGCMATNDPAIAEKARMISQHGQKGKHNHLIEGRNSRLDGLQAAILLAKLPYLGKWTEARIAHTKKYDSLLRDAGVCIPPTRNDARHVYHLYVVRTANRDQLQKNLSDAGIETALHYPTALPFLPCYINRNFKPGDFPIAHSSQSSILSLPLYPEMQDSAIEYVCATIKKNSRG
ncbi:MAG TPA: DegT/DnrJ/EryC1/StrS family aminotransferase [Puia sp.]|jgi:dTDP-4-amino-4,6-dideoxygalactose transaminase|nr:DegT/DnrJ/EryC1/StrS family aminotransferase [Puia sp.]